MTNDEICIDKNSVIRELKKTIVKNLLPIKIYCPMALWKKRTCIPFYLFLQL